MYGGDENSNESVNGASDSSIHSDHHELSPPSSIKTITQVKNLENHSPENYMQNQLKRLTTLTNQVSST